MIEVEVQQIVSRYLQRIRPGANGEISAICPFHRKPDGSMEKNPSFTMNTTKGVFYCHTCHSAGNFRTFLKNVGVNAQTLTQYGPLLDALQKNRAPQFNPLKPKNIVSEEPLPEAILGLFEKCPVPLVHPDPECRLQKDDPMFDEALLQAHDIGFDEKHRRITFPLRDIQGNLIGISGRACDSGVARYKVYDIEYKDFGLPVRQRTLKSTVLWNAHNVYEAIFKTTTKVRVVLVEGFKACLWLLQAGINNVVALAGCDLSDYHLWLLERMGAQVVLMFDNDEAGQSALLDAAPQLARSLDVFIVNYEGRQPTNLALDEVRYALENNCEDYYLWITKAKKKLKENNHGVR